MRHEYIIEYNTKAATDLMSPSSHIHVYVYMGRHIYTFLHIHVYVYMGSHIYVYIHICMYMYTPSSHIYVYIHVYVRCKILCEMHMQYVVWNSQTTASN